MQAVGNRVGPVEHSPRAPFSYALHSLRIATPVDNMATLMN